MVKSKAAPVNVEEQKVLKNDLTILFAMVDGMAAYLAGDATWWDMGQVDLPLLTIGGYLMRRRRLVLLESRLSGGDREALTAANAAYDQIAGSQIVRFEQRASSELVSRLREWTTYLRDLAVSRRLAADTERYTYLADTRVVISELVEKLNQSPFHLAEHLEDDIAALDNRLRYRWVAKSFIWSPVWSSAYPADPYWWLYGHPKAD